MDEEEKYKPTNRQKRLTPKTGKHWCVCCDMHLVGNGGKCTYCGTRQLPRKLRK